MTNRQMRLGKKIRSLRENRSWLQKELAEKATLPVRTIGRIERGNVDVRLSTLEKIAKAFKIPIRELFL